jgi:LacI family xylobiose transport system transcriptional regulator
VRETRRYSERVDATGEQGAGRAKLADVAALAGVSVSTVSKVLNGRAGIAEETRARVEALLQDRRYNRRAPGKTPARLLEVLCYEIDSPFASEAMSSIERVCAGENIGMVLSSTTDEHLPPAGWSDAVLHRQPIGVILVAARLRPGERERLAARGVPIVLVDPAGSPDPGVPTIGSADWNGGFVATRHLLDLGHSDIAIITGPDDMLASTARLSGYRAALEAAGVTIDPGYVRPGQFHYRDGLEQGRSLLTGPQPPTAIFASSDMQALGVYEAARTLGLVIPRDLSVVGYDDLRIAQWAGPPLTTIRVPLAEMAEQAARLALRLGGDPGEGFSRIDLATSLVVRESTAAPDSRSGKRGSQVSN